MAKKNTLRRALLDKLESFHETLPLLRTRILTRQEIEERALRFARRFVDTYAPGEARYPTDSGGNQTRILLPEGGRMRVYHASAALAARSGLGPMEQLIGARQDKPRLQRATEQAARKLGLFELESKHEKLAFERLWLIKATGVTLQGRRGDEVLCRAVGAFRRRVHGFPVWGRASAHVEIAAEGRLSSFGLDWRAVHDEPVDLPKSIDPEAAADRVLRELEVPGGGIAIDAEDFTPELFAQGYLSHSRRRAQAFLQPVYVALLRSHHWARMSRVIAIPAMSSPPEPLCRIAQQAAPSDSTKPTVKSCR